MFGRALLVAANKWHAQNPNTVAYSESLHATFCGYSFCFASCLLVLHANALSSKDTVQFFKTKASNVIFASLQVCTSFSICWYVLVCVSMF